MFLEFGRLEKLLVTQTCIDQFCQVIVGSFPQQSPKISLRKKRVLMGYLSPLFFNLINLT